MIPSDALTTATEALKTSAATVAQSAERITRALSPGVDAVAKDADAGAGHGTPAGENAFTAGPQQPVSMAPDYLESADAVVIEEYVRMTTARTAYSVAADLVRTLDDMASKALDIKA